jgi:hypothetical protein
MPFISTMHRLSFNRIMAQLMKVGTSEKRIVSIFQQANKFLVEHDISWDAVTVRISNEYVPISRRAKRPVHPTLSAAVQAAAAVSGQGKLGYDGRNILKKAIVKHPDWPTVRDVLEVDMQSSVMADLLAIAQLLKIDEQFLKLFADGPAQAELKFNGKHQEETKTTAAAITPSGNADE